MRLLIVGCGRSGTRYTTKVLQRAGLDIGHEKPRQHGMVHWKSVVVQGHLDAHDVVWHQVREPLGVISSFHTVGESSWQFICKHEQRIGMDDPLLLRCMKYWHYWNQRCEEVAAVTFRVENMAAILPNILRRMNIRVDGRVTEDAMRVPDNDHTRKRGHRRSGMYSPITWADMESVETALASSIRTQAKMYGYA